MQDFMIYFPLSAVLLLGALLLSFTVRWFREERYTGFKLLAITSLVALSIATLRMPLYLGQGESSWESFLHGVISALQAIGLDADLGEVIEEGACLIDDLPAGDFALSQASAFARAYVSYAIVQYALALLLCAFALVKALSRVMLRTLLRLSGQTVFFFSALTEDAILLARSIQDSMKASRKRGILCFLTPEDELSAALAPAWQEAGLKNAVRLTGGLTHKQFPLFAPSVNCILCSPDEQVNIDTLASLLAEGTTSRSFRRRSVNYFIFAQSRQAEQAIDAFSATYITGQQKSARLICMLNPKENLAVHILDKAPLHEYAARNDDGSACLNILIAGSTPLADRFLRNAYSCGQLHDCRLRITLADPDAQAYQEQLLTSAPLLRQAEHPVIRGCGELRFHLLPSRASIADEALVQDAHYILLAYDNDQDNIRAARRIRRIIERQKLTDPARAAQDVAIVYVVEDVVMNAHCTAADPAASAMPYTPCRMLPIGSRAVQNKTEVLFGHELLRRAFFLEQAYTGALSLPRNAENAHRMQRAFVKFMNSAYNRRSSVSAALHLKYRDYARRTLDLPPSALEVALSHVEHRRWNAYMVMAGYMPPTPEQLEAYFYQGCSTHKCDLLRLHPCMVPSKPGFTENLWDLSSPALDELDELSRRVHGMLLKRLKAMGVPTGMISLENKKTLDPTLLTVLMADEKQKALAQRMCKALFTDYKQFDLDIVKNTAEILQRAGDPNTEAALRLFWLEE